MLLNKPLIKNWMGRISSPNNTSKNHQVLQSDLEISQMEVTFSAPKRLFMGPNEITLKNLAEVLDDFLGFAY